MKSILKNRKAQVWIETVLYTLIGLALIGTVLAFVMPKITESKDKLLVGQTINSISDLDLKINEVLRAKGSVRHVDFTMKTGKLFFYSNSSSQPNKIVFVLSELKKPYSEPGVEINEGKVIILSTEGQKTSTINLTLEYNGRLDLVNFNNEKVMKFNPSSTPYRFRITNNGDKGGNDLDDIFIEEVSGG